MALLTIALVLAAKKENPASYTTSLDGFRLLCEVIVLVGILIDGFIEVLDFCTN